MKTRRTSRSQRDKKMIAQKERIHKRIRQEMGTPHCGKGEIIREGYRRRSYSRKSGSSVKSARVAPGCIQARGLSKKRGSKGKQLFILEKGTLGKYGYHDVEHMSQKERHDALHRALKDMSPLSVYRKLNAVYLVNRNTNPNISATFKTDSEWVKKQPEYIGRPTARQSSKKSSRKSRK
jgi:hypothetical protein